MKTYTDEQYAVLGMQIIEARRKGGKMVLKKYGPNHYSEMGKISASRRKTNKEIAESIRG